MNVIKVSLAAAALVCMSGAANAIVIDKDFTLPAPFANLLDPTSTTGDVRIDFVGNDLVNPSPNSRSPWDGTVHENTAQYHSVSAGATATYEFGSVQNVFALMWGSPDDYNTLEFFLGGASQGSVLGSDVDNPPPPGQGFVNVRITDIAFDKVVFSSTQDAFEFAQVAVPVPAALPLLSAGIGLLGLMGWRKRRSA